MNRVLVVDADSATIAFFRDVLDQNYEMQTAANGKEALIMLPNFRPDVGVVEIELEDMMGWQLAAKMRQHKPHLPIIAIASNASWDNIRQMRIEAEPILFYAVKPLNRHEMQEAIQAAVSLHQHV